MRSVGEAAGVANGTVYWHFKSKSDLYLAVVKHAATGFHRDVAPTADSPLASFLDVVDREIQYLRQNPAIDAVLSSLRSPHPRADPSEAECMRQAAQAVDDRLLDVWRRWIRGRQWQQPTNGEYLARLIVSTVSGLLVTRFIDPRMDIRAPLTHFGTFVHGALADPPKRSAGTTATSLMAEHP